MSSNHIARAAKVWLVVAAVFGSMLVVSSAWAHTCSYNPVGVPLWAGSVIRAYSRMDCSVADAQDLLTVQLWRKNTGLPDDHWATATDAYPPNWDSNTYYANAQTCEDPNIQDDYVNKSFFDGDHSIDASADSGVLSACN